MSYVNFSIVVRDILIDFVSLYFFAYAILYKKYRNKELFVTVSLFNAFLLMVIMAMVRTDFNIAIGFGLFAVLSMVTLRSAPFTKAEMAYLFGGVALAVINGAGIENLTFIIMCNVVIISCSFVISSWSIEHSASIIEVDNIGKMQITLDQIDDDINNHSIMNQKLRKLLKLNILNFEVRSIDYVRDTVNLMLTYEMAEDGDPQLAVDKDTEISTEYAPNADATLSREN